MGLREQMKKFYETCDAYLDVLNTHDENYLKDYLSSVRYYVSKNMKNKYNVYVLELGCGDGRASYLLSKNFKVVGTDFSSKFIEYAKKNFKGEDLEYIIGDAIDLPFKDRTFDIVCSFEFIEHVTNVPKAFSEMVRVLENNGLVIIQSPNLCSPLFPLLDLHKMFLGSFTRDVWSETNIKAFKCLLKNLIASFRKRISSEPNFIYRQPDLLGNVIGGDSDSVYLANQMDIEKFLKKRKFEIINLVGKPRTRKPIITWMNFDMLIVARKRA